ncbi:HDOD domain-containing protein [Pigmentibacter ruber]|uniref:HDOD domain-containing protein n=1 Tax=Pigmentibacter ruber TaxID=2683196 RepID=UPI00131C74EE|nr:HDOD domain-containing protein [Pigmentibacter ruber]BFD32539.1 HDOD domain-containing protein [Pigmentibacter ruber]
MENNSAKDIKLPSIPDAVRECLAQMYSSEADIAKLANHAQKDAGITSSILKLANSSVYSMGQSTSDLKVGMTRIGLSSLMQILIKYSIEKLFEFEAIDFFNVKSFTKHSSWVSQVAFEIAKHLKIEALSDLLVAGLLHDVGLLVRTVSDKNLMKQVTEKCLKEKIDFNIAEKLLKLEPHEQLAEVLLQKWQLPQNVIILIKYHHTEEKFRPKTLSSDQNKLINIMCLADTIAHRFGNAFQNYHRDTRVNQIELEKIGLTSQDVGNIVKHVTQQLQFF